MKQIATVMRMVDDTTAEVTVVRQSACSHDCSECAGCGSKPSAITVLAHCQVSVTAGDKVELFSDNRILGYAALVYLAPLVLFLVGYLAPPDAVQWLRGVLGGAGFLSGIFLAMICDRVVKRKKSVNYRIIRKI